MAATMTRKQHRLRPYTGSRSRLLLFVLAAAAVTLLVVLGVVAQRGEQVAETQTSRVEGQRDATGGQAADLAADVQAACRTELLQGPVCDTADDVAADPIIGPPGARGRLGEPGQAGRAGGVGPAGGVGERGGIGDPGAPGESITGPGGEAGQAGSPGERGPGGDPGESIEGPGGPRGEPGESIQGPPGESITGPAGPPGESIQGPPGPAGAPGMPGRDGSPAASYTMVFDDGTTRQCVRDGGPDTAPVYRCTDVPAPDNGGGGG